MNRRAFAQAAVATGVAASTRPLWAQQAKPPVQLENHYLFLVRQPPVQRELELRPDQIKAVQAATDKVDGSLFLLRDVSAADRIQRSKPLIQQVQRDLDPILSDICIMHQVWPMLSLNQFPELCREVQICLETMSLL